MPKTRTPVTAIFRNMIICAVTVAPIANILNLITLTGADNLSNDLAVHLRVISGILDGTYPWAQFAKDIFYNGHFLFFPTLLRVILARFVYWNTYVELLCGAGAVVLTLFLLYSALTARTRHRLRGWMWPALAALLFSTAQANQFTFGDASVPIGFSTLGISTTLWSLIRFPRQWKGVLLAIVGAVFASWSWAQGVVAWPLLIAGMVVINGADLGACSPSTHTSAPGRRYRWSHYATVIGAALVTLYPYVAFIVLWPVPAGMPVRLTHLLKPEYMLATIGWPFVNDIGTVYSPTLPAVLIGLSGLFCAALATVLIVARRSQWQWAVPAWLIMSAGLVSIWELNLFRDAITPWYTGIAALFWIGLLGLAYTLFAANTAGAGKASHWLARGLATLVIAGIALAYLSVNRTYSDKVMHLYSRAPASAACLRYQQYAPTRCEGLLFQWGIGSPGVITSLAERLKSHNLSVFAPNQRWALQGDFVLDTVQVHETPAPERVRWLEDGSLKSLPWNDYRHLNLALPPSSAVSWTFYLPKTAQQAEFRSAVILLPGTTLTQGGTATTATVHLRSDVVSPTIIFSHSSSPGDNNWYPITFSLMPYTGQTITLQLAAGAGEGSALFRYPHIDVLFDAEPATAAERWRVATVAPPGEQNDHVFNTQHETAWAAHHLRREGSGVTGRWAMTDAYPTLTYTFPLNVCLANYSHVRIRLEITKAIRRPIIQWYIVSQQGQQERQESSFQISLFAAEDMHDVTYPLRLLNLNQDARLTNFNITLVSKVPVSGDAWMNIRDVRLTGWQPGDFCSQPPRHESDSP